MKLKEISLNEHPYIFDQELFETDMTHTPAGRLLLALLSESAWSKDYLVTGRLEDRFSPTTVRSITIEHQSFKGFPLVIEPTGWSGWSVRRVEEAIRNHLESHMDLLRQQMTELQTKIGGLRHAWSDIDMEKARAAVLTRFPDAGELQHVAFDPDDLHGFFRDHREGPSYLVRMLDHEPTGGVIRLTDSARSWYMLTPGVRAGERHGYFWAALARAFAAQELKIPEKDLTCKSVYAIENPWKEGQIDPYVVEKIILFRKNTGANFIVTFADNLPAAIRAEDTASV